MTTYTVALLEGDGIGPEVAAESVKVLDALKGGFGVSFEFRKIPAGDGCKAEKGEALPDSSISAIKDSDVCLKAPVGDTAADVIVRLRQLLKLYANIRPSKTLPHVPSLKPGIDLVIVRENTEDLYKGMEFEFDGGVIALKTTTKKACERIAVHAFELAQTRRAKQVVAVHKSNVLRKSDGLFAQVCKDAARRFPQVSFSEMLVDSAAMNLIRIPEKFDVIVTSNMYGDILSDEAAQTVGGLGLAPSANIGDDFAIFEPVHGAAPDIAGKGEANPVAMLLTSSMMLEWLSKKREDQSCAQAASAIRGAVDRSLETGVMTPDLGGSSSTAQVGDAIARLVGS
jgi:3-isopropylmalate dehydrogenase